MLKDFTVANLLDLNETIAAELFEGKTYPWEVLPEISDFIMKLGPTLNPSEYECRDGNVWIARSAKVAPTASINGPAIIGKDAEVRHCAFIRGNAIVGEGSVVGNSTELKNVSFTDGDYREPIENTYRQYLADREEIFKGRDDKFVCLMDLALMARRKLRKEGKLEDGYVSRS